MSIAVGLIDLASAEAQKASAKAVNRLEVEIGTLAGIEIPALTFCYESACKGTICEGAELRIHEIQGRGRCPACGHEGDVDFFVAICPACGKAGLDILQGRELRLRSLNID